MATVFATVKEYVKTNNESFDKRIKNLDRMKEKAASRKIEGRKLLDSLPEILQINTSLERQSLIKKPKKRDVTLLA